MARWSKENLEFKEITNSELQCKNCNFLFDDKNAPGNVSKCEIYDRKPNAILKGKYVCNFYLKAEGK